jgi:hypothetical protein
VECTFEFVVWQLRECGQRLRTVKVVVLVWYQLPANQFGGWESTRLNNVHFSSILVRLRSPSMSVCNIIAVVYSQSETF